jgi:hypothetical protein
MSDLSLRDYAKAALQQQDGTVRLEAGDKEAPQLVNKGTIGQKIASFFKGIAVKLGAKDDRANRNAETVMKFSTALKGRYGEVGDKALQDALKENDGKLTGRAVVRSLNLAHARQRELNKDLRESALNGSLQFDELERQRSFPRMKIDTQKAYDIMLKAELNKASDFGRKKLGEAEVKEIVKKSVTEVLNLEAREAIGGVRIAQQQLERTLGSTIETMAKSKDPQEIYDALHAVDKDLDKLAKAMKREPFSAEERRDLVRSMVDEAGQSRKSRESLSSADRAPELAPYDKDNAKSFSISHGHKEFLQVQKNALDEKSALHEVSRQGKEVPGSNRHDDQQKADWKNALGTARGIVMAMGDLVGTQGRSMSEDLSKF